MNSSSITIDNGPNIEPPHFKYSDAVIGKLLLDIGKLKQHDVERVLKLQREQNLRFGEAAVRLGLVSEADIQNVLSLQFEYPNLSNAGSGLSQELVAAVAPFSREAEALRSVRSQLLLRWLNNDIKTLAVSSAQEGEGASYLAANLAVLFAQLGKKTLLIDADLRLPRQHKIFNLGNSKGLSDILVGRADATIVNPVKSFPALSILCSGSPPPNPAELLMRPAFGALLRSLESSYDLIVVDTSSSQYASDIQAVASQVGRVLITARRNKSRLTSLAELKEKITVTGAQVIGAVVLD